MANRWEPTRSSSWKEAVANFYSNRFVSGLSFVTWLSPDEQSCCKIPDEASRILKAPDSLSVSCEPCRLDWLDSKRPDGYKASGALKRLFPLEEGAGKTGSMFEWFQEAILTKSIGIALSPCNVEMRKWQRQINTHSRENSPFQGEVFECKPFSLITSRCRPSLSGNCKWKHIENKSDKVQVKKTAIICQFETV